ncbi:hypothetical protein ACRRTK_017032 [Alexandromys fortis]
MSHYPRTTDEIDQDFEDAYYVMWKLEQGPSGFQQGFWNPQSTQDTLFYGNQMVTNDGYQAFDEPQEQPAAGALLPCGHWAPSSSCPQRLLRASAARVPLRAWERLAQCTLCDPPVTTEAAMPGSLRSSAHEAGSALLSLQQEDQENVNPEKVAPAQQPRAQIALKAGNARGNAPQQRFKTWRVAPLKDLSVNDEQVAVGPSWKANSKQPAFTIHVDEAEEPDYHEDIHTYLREMEVKCKPKVGYMKKQPDITNSMRAILVDWLVEVGEEYKLPNETLHLAVNYIDRFLSSMSVSRGKLQLVGTAAMLLASKFEEIYPPEVAEFVSITDDTYSKKQVLRMEQLILKVLAFDLAAPTVNQFLTLYFLHQQPANCKVESLAMFLGELSLIDADPYLKYLPSLIAGAAFHLALYTVTGQSWPESLVQKTGYTLESLKPCLMDLYQTYLRAPQHAQQSIREKYKHSKYQGVSLLNPPETLNV